MYVFSRMFGLQRQLKVKCVLATMLVIFGLWQLIHTHILYNYDIRHRGSKKPELSVPNSVSEAVGTDEWISRTITDQEQKCASSQKASSYFVAKSKTKLSCNIPNLDPYHPSVKAFLKDVGIPNCSKRKSYGKLVEGRLSFTDPGVVSATYRLIVRSGDFKHILGAKAVVNQSKIIKDEFIEVDYVLKDGKHVSEIFMQPVLHEHLMNRGGIKPGIPLNILIIGIDSLAHVNAQRKLPKVYDLLKNKFKAFIFNGHSIVGDGTTEQLAAMLCGLGELEQYESRRHHKNPRPVDGWNWIYKQLKEHGYLTGYSGDLPQFGPFQYRLKGFKDPPTDFYTRPFFQKADPYMFLNKNNPDRCLGSRPVTKCQFDYVLEIFQMYQKKLKFFFSFNVYYSHNDLNGAAKNEPDLFSFLQQFRDKGYLNNTLLIVMGDHGSRYGEFREVLQGKLEERLPFFSMTFPPWFATRYPEIAKHLRTNTDRLTSWYDVYATFRHMLSYPEVPSDLKHGQSLFEEAPLSRTCADANVEAHWCPCLEMYPVNVNYSHVKNAALAAVEYINSLLQEQKASDEYCQPLVLKKINYALLEKPNEKVLSFKETNDLRPAFSTGSIPKQERYCRYQLQIMTSPNDGIYEVTVRYYKTWFIVSQSISRVDRYGDQPECIARDLPHLRKFCLCKRKP